MRHTNKALAALVAIPLIYVAAYLCLVQKDAGYSASKETLWKCAPHYRFGGQVATGVFRPAYLIDVKLRPNYWDAMLGPRKINLKRRDWMW